MAGSSGGSKRFPVPSRRARTLDQCRENLRDSLQLMLETHRDEARMPLDATCIQESLDIEVPEPSGTSAHDLDQWSQSPATPHSVA